MFHKKTAFACLASTGQKIQESSFSGHHFLPTNTATAHYALPQPVSFLLSDAASTTPATTFEPVLNVPALGTFVVIMSMALVLYLRVGAISDAAERRIAALEELREVKSKELSNEVSSEQVALAVAEYETALTQEEDLRTLLPGVRIRAPNNPVVSERDQQAARQFLSNSTVILPPDDSSSRTSSLSPLAITLLVTFLFGTQLFLFAFLAMDDTTATQVFNSITSDDTTRTTLMQSPSQGTVAETVGNIMGME